MVDVLTVKKKEPSKIKADSWVRIKRGVYSGDLGYVVELIADEDIARVKVLPRIDVGEVCPPAFLNP